MSSTQPVLTRKTVRTQAPTERVESTPEARSYARLTGEVKLAAASPNCTRKALRSVRSWYRRRQRHRDTVKQPVAVRGLNIVWNTDDGDRPATDDIFAGRQLSIVGGEGAT